MQFGSSVLAAIGASVSGEIAVKVLKEPVEIGIAVDVVGLLVDVGIAVDVVGGTVDVDGISGAAVD